MCIYDDGNSVSSKKEIIFIMQNLGIWMLSGKVPYLESSTVVCLFTMQLLWGYDDD